MASTLNEQATVHNIWSIIKTQNVNKTVNKDNIVTEMHTMCHYLIKAQSHSPELALHPPPM